MFRSLFLFDLEIFSILLMPLLFVVSVLLCSLFLLGSIAFSTVFERKTIAILQNRRGPNRAGWFGLLQAIGDGVKLVTKAQVSKKQQSSYSYFFAPFAALFLSWFMAYFMLFASFDDFSLYFLLIWTSMNVYSLPLAGIVTSRSRFALLGGIRSFAQLLSYELGLTVIFLTIVVYTGTPILGGVMEFQVSHESLFYSMLPVFLIWFVIILAETNRVPFDLPEAEAELVAGFATEYSGFAFAAFFLAEYGSMLIYSYLTAVLFFYPMSPSLLTVFFFFVFVWARTTLPRYKVDQLLWIGWYCFIPLTLVLYVVYYFRFNFIGFFTGSLFSFIGIGSPSISNRYNVVNKKAFMLLQKQGNINQLKNISRKVWIFGVEFLRDFGKLVEFFSDRYLSNLPEKPVPSRTWLLLPLFNVLFSYFQLLSCAHGVYYISFIKHLESLGTFSYTAFGAMLLFFCSMVLGVVAAHVRLIRAECTIFSVIVIFLFNCTDYLTFYIAFESLVAPTLFLIYKNRETGDFPRAAALLILFSFFTMFFFLISTLFLYIYFQQMSYISVIAVVQSQYDETIYPMFKYMFFFSFAFKMSLFPFYVWLPKAHVEGDLAMSWVLGGVILKAALYGIFYYCIVPFSTGYVSPVLLFVCFVGMLYPLVLAVTEQHLKRMVAFFSVSHMSFAVLLLLQFSFTMQMSDCYLTMCGMILGTMHTFISNMLFLLIDMFYRQTKTKLRIFYSAILERPALAALTFLLMLDNVGALPLTFNFCTEVTAFVILVTMHNWQLVIVVSIYLLMSNVVAFNQLLRFWRVFKYSYKKDNSVLVPTREKGVVNTFEPSYRLSSTHLITAIIVISVYLLFMWNVGAFFQNILLLDLVSFV